MAKSRVPIGDIVLEDLRLGPSSYAYSLSGRLRNRNSKYRVRSLALRIVVRDCDSAAAQSSCDVVGDANESLSVDVPAGQVRDINDSVYFSSGTKVRGRMEWTYEITGVTAD